MECSWIQDTLGNGDLKLEFLATFLQVLIRVFSLKLCERHKTVLFVGAVPPGARFDPFGPPDPDAMPPVRGPRPLGPRGGFGDPDPDHLRPPF